MASEFMVRINRRDGILEIEGSDKAWIAEQVERLSVVYENPPANVHGNTPASTSATPTHPATPGSTPASATPGTTSPSRTRRTGRGGTRANLKPELEQALTPELRTALEAYKDERSANWAGKPNQAAIVATFLMDNVNWGGWIDPDDLYTVYSVMGWSDPPSNYRSVINNARQRNGYFGRWTDGRVQLTHAGERFGRHGSKAS